MTKGSGGGGGGGGYSSGVQEELENELSTLEDKP